ncbi:nitrogen fixation protein NifZ [Xanthobacter agilis]|nr:nitrogen fixation protein NifZ [Xanthobacter agilis]
MFDQRLPKYEWGMKVKTLIELRNDGSYPEALPDALLVDLGTIGEIVQVGSHTETNTPIYLVEFNERLVIGCLEEEIEPV